MLLQIKCWGKCWGWSYRLRGSLPTIIWESTNKTVMKLEPSATTMTNKIFTRRQSVCGSHLPYVTPSAGCGLPLFRLSGKLFKTEISYKRREHRVYSAEQGRHITVRCYEVTCPSKEWWQIDFTCKDVCSWMATPSCSVGIGTELLQLAWLHKLTLSGSQHGAPTTLTMWGSGASW